MAFPILFNWECLFYIPFENLKNVEDEFRATAQKYDTAGPKGKGLGSEWSLRLLPASRSANGAKRQGKDMSIVTHTIRFSHKVDAHGTYLMVVSEQKRILDRMKELYLTRDVRKIPGFVYYRLSVADTALLPNGRYVSSIMSPLQVPGPCEFYDLAEFICNLFGQQEKATARERTRWLAAQQKVKATVDAVLQDPSQGHEAAKKSLEKLATQNRKMMNFMDKTFANKFVFELCQLSCRGPYPSRQCEYCKVDTEIGLRGRPIPGATYALKLKLKKLHYDGHSLDSRERLETPLDKALAKKQLDEELRVHKERLGEFHRRYRTLQHDVSSMTAAAAAMWQYVNRVSRWEEVVGKLKILGAVCDTADLQRFLQSKCPELDFSRSMSVKPWSRSAPDLKSTGERKLGSLMRRQGFLRADFDMILSDGLELAAKDKSLVHRMMTVTKK
ncbi:hypothetical protein ACHAQH_007144 [Verticillium albo-atrum]